MSSNFPTTALPVYAYPHLTSLPGIVAESRNLIPLPARLNFELQVHLVIVALGNLEMTQLLGGDFFFVVGEMPISTHTSD